MTQSLLQLDPALPIFVPRLGQFGFVHVLRDDGIEHDTLFLCWLNDGTIWWLPQSQVRGCENATIGRGKS